MANYLAINCFEIQTFEPVRVFSTLIPIHVHLLSSWTIVALLCIFKSLKRPEFLTSLLS